METFEDLSEQDTQKELADLEDWRKKCSILQKKHLIYFLADEEINIIKILKPLKTN
jgi:hypothetical protein